MNKNLKILLGLVTATVVILPIIFSVFSLIPMEIENANPNTGDSILEGMPESSCHCGNRIVIYNSDLHPSRDNVVDDVIFNNTVKYIQVYGTDRTLIFENCIFVNLNARNDYIDPLFLIQYCEDIIFRNCSFIECDICITIEYSSDITIENCTFEKCSYPIQFSQSLHNSVNNNDFIECYHCIELYCQTHSNLIFLNKFLDCITPVYDFHSSQTQFNNQELGLGNYYNDRQEELQNSNQYNFTDPMLEGRFNLPHSSIETGDMIYAITNIELELTEDISDFYPIVEFVFDNSFAFNLESMQQFRDVPELSIDYEEVFFTDVTCTIASIEQPTVIYEINSTGLTESIWNAFDDGQIEIKISGIDVFGRAIQQSVIIVKNTEGPNFDISSERTCYSNFPPTLEFNSDDSNQINSMVIEICSDLSETQLVFTNFIESISISYSNWNTFADGAITVNATLTDYLGNSRSKLLALEKDCQAPLINFNASTEVISITDQNSQNALETEIRIIPTGLSIDTQILTNLIEFNSSSIDYSCIVIISATDEAGNQSFDSIKIERDLEESENGNNLEFSTLDYSLLVLSITGVILSAASFIKSRKNRPPKMSKMISGGK